MVVMVANAQKMPIFQGFQTATKFGTLRSKCYKTPKYPKNHPKYAERSQESLIFAS